MVFTFMRVDLNDMGAASLLRCFSFSFLGSGVGVRENKLTVYSLSPPLRKMA